MPASVFHVLTATTPDDPSFEIRPQAHWNAAHAVTLNLSGTDISQAFSNAGNVSFALETNGRITASANVTAAPSPVNVTAGTTSGNLQTIAFSNSNGVSFGLNGSTVTASHNGITSQSVQTQNLVSVLGSTGNISFANSNGITFGGNASTITASHNGLTTAAQSDHSHGNPTLNLTNLSGTTASNSAGLTLSLSAAAQSVQTQNLVSVQGSTGNISFSNSNGITFGFNASTITASHNGLTTAAQSNHSHGNPTLALTNLSGTTASNSAGLTLSLSAAAGGGGADGYNILAAGTQTAGTATTVNFANSNGVTFGMSGSSQITASHNGITSQTAQTVGIYGTSNTTGQSSSSTYDARSLTIRGYGVLSVGNSNGSILLSTPDPVDFTQLSVGASNVGNTAGNTGVVTGRLVLAGGNNVTLSGSTNAGSMTLTVSAANQTNQTLGLYHSNNTTGQSSSSTVDARSITFVGQGNVSVGMSAGSVLISGGTAAAAPVQISAGTTSGNLSNIVFSNSNNVSFGLNGSTITASHNGLTTAALSNHSHGDPQLNLTNLSGTTASNSAGLTLSLSAAAQSVQTQNLVSVQGSTGNISFSNSNGITFGFNASTITASHNGLTSQSNQAVSAANGSYAFQTLSFSNANGVSFGTSAGSAITASHNGLTTAALSDHSHGNPTLNLTNLSGTTASNSAGFTLSLSAAAPSGGGVAVSANGSSQNAGTVVWSNSNNVSFGMNGSTITATVTVPAQSNQTGGIYAVGNTTGQSSSSTYDLRTLSVDGAGLVSAGWSNGTLRISGTQSNQAFSASGGSSAFQTLGFENANGFTFSNVGGSVRGSYTVPSVTQFFSATNTTFNGANVSGSMTLNTNGLQLSLSAAAGGGGVTPVASASNGSFSFTTIAFSNANNVTFGTSAGSIITASVAAPGAAAENNAIALLGVNTSGNTTATGSTIGWSGVNVTLSGTNNSQVVISAPATSSLVGVSGVSVSTNGSTISVYDNGTFSGYFEPYLDRELLAAQIGNAQLFVQPMRLKNHVQFNEIIQPINFSNASNSSNSATLSLLVGFYTRNASTLSLVTSASSSYAVTASGTVGSYSIFGGPRHYPIPFTSTLTKGDYFIGLLSRTTTGGGAGMTWSNFVATNINSAYSGRFSSANNATNQFVMGQGSYATTTTAIPSSIALSQINGSAAANLRPVVYKLVSGDLN